MKPLPRYAIAGVELLLIFPALLFMIALFVRNLQPSQYEPAHTAQQIVAWYAMRPHVALWGFLMSFPLVVLITGVATLLRRWSHDSELRHASQTVLRVLSAHLSTLLVAAATAAAGGVLAIVALHAATD